MWGIVLTLELNSLTVRSKIISYFSDCSNVITSLNIMILTFTVTSTVSFLKLERKSVDKIVILSLQCILCKKHATNSRFTVQHGPISLK